ncbi:hypothetical protein CR513_00308, partial [Mucuna pruriens]
MLAQERSEEQAHLIEEARKRQEEAKKHHKEEISRAKERKARLREQLELLRSAEKKLPTMGKKIILGVQAHQQYNLGGAGQREACVEKYTPLKATRAQILKEDGYIGRFVKRKENEKRTNEEFRKRDRSRTPRRDRNIDQNRLESRTIPHLDDSMVISVIIVDYRVKRVLIDQGNSANMLFWLAFQKLGLLESSIEVCPRMLIGFADEQVEIRDMINLVTILGIGSIMKVTRKYIVLDEEKRIHLLELDPRFDREDARPQPDEDLKEELKTTLASPPILTWPVIVSSVIIQEEEDEQRPIYYGAKLRYQKIEKAALAIVIIAKKLKPYFQNHPVICRTELPIRQILRKPNLVGRMIGRDVKLSEFDIAYKRKGHMKTQVLANFINELTLNSYEEEAVGANKEWTLSVDRSSNKRGSGAWVILEGPSRVEYEALLVGIRLAKELGMKMLTVKSDSQLVTRQLYGQGFSFPLLQYLGETEVERAIKEVHKEACGSHLGRRALASEIALAYLCGAPRAMDKQRPPTELFSKDYVNGLKSDPGRGGKVVATHHVYPEEREMAYIHEYTTKARVAKRYNSMVFPRPIRKDDLVLRRTLKGATTNKLTPN